MRWERIHETISHDEQPNAPTTKDFNDLTNVKLILRNKVHSIIVHQWNAVQ